MCLALCVRNFMEIKQIDGCEIYRDGGIWRFQKNYIFAFGSILLALSRCDKIPEEAKIQGTTLD